ncbi:MAG: hypothetical protein RL477_2252 [Pseudomonadota bacterium]|jgi:hypothetical protein
MPAISKAQQRAAGMALAARRGEIDPRKLKGAARDMYATMTEQQLHDYAATASKRLPEHRAGKRPRAS